MIHVLPLPTLRYPKKFFTELRKSFAYDNFFSEESNSLDEVLELNSRYSWILNPIDGTSNYALGIPACAISLALLKDGIPVYAYVYDMLQQRLIEGGPQNGLIAGCRKITARLNPMGKHSTIGIEFLLIKIDAGNWRLFLPTIIYQVWGVVF